MLIHFLCGVCVEFAHFLVGVLQRNAMLTDYKGAMTEQFVMQQLRLNKENKIYYWSQDNSQGELDFLVQQGEQIIPIEVKAEENLQSKSLRLFVQSNEGLHGMRFSMSGYKEQTWLTNYPLYAINVVIQKLR